MRIGNSLRSLFQSSELLLDKFGHFSDSSEPADSNDALDSSPGRSFLTPKSRVLTGLTREVQNVRLAALDLRDLRDGSGGSGLDPGILGFRVSPEFMCSHFLLNVTFSVSE